MVSPITWLLDHLNIGQLIVCYLNSLLCIHLSLTWASRMHDGKSMFLIILLHFLSFSTMQTHAQVGRAGRKIQWFITHRAIIQILAVHLRFIRQHIHHDIVIIARNNIFPFFRWAMCSRILRQATCCPVPGLLISKPCTLSWLETSRERPWDKSRWLMRKFRGEKELRYLEPILFDNL